MLTGFEHVDEAQKNEYQQMALAQTLNTGLNQAEFTAFYGKPYAEFRHDGHQDYGYGFSREGGVDLVALYMLGKGYSIDTVFFAENTPDILNLKRAHGLEFMDMLDEEIPEMVNNQTISDDIIKGRMEFTEFDAGDYEVNMRMYESLFNALPAIQREMEELTEKVDFTDPKALQSPEGKKLLRLSAFVWDTYQELTRGQVTNLAREDAMEEYNRLHPDEPPMTYDRLADFVGFTSLARLKCNYDNAVNIVLNEGITESNFATLVKQGYALKKNIETYQNNKKNNPEADAFSLVPEKDMMAPFNASEEVEPICSLTLPLLLENVGEAGLTSSIISGEFFNKIDIPAPKADGTIERGSILDYEVDKATEKVRTPEDGLSPVERKIKQYGKVVEYQKNADKYSVGSSEFLKSLSGETKEEFLNNTISIMYAFERESATGILVCALLNKGLTVDEIMDPNARVEDKRAEAAYMKSLLQNKGYAPGSPEFIQQTRDFDNYAVTAYQGAQPTLKAAVKEATEKQEYYQHPEMIRGTREGLKHLLLVETAFDLNQELSKTRQSQVVNEHDPNLLDQIVNLGAAAAKFKSYGEMLDGTKAALASELNSNAISTVFKAKLNEMTFNKIVNGNPNFDYATEFDGLHPEVHEAAKTYGKATSFYADRLSNYVNKNFTQEELSQKIADGTLINSLRIEVQNGEIQSMSILGLTAEKDSPVVRDEQGNDIGSDISADTKARYIKEVNRMKEAINKSDSIFITDNTDEFKAVKTSINALEQKLSRDDLKFNELADEIGVLSALASAYKTKHKDVELNSRQKKRTNIMNQIIKLSTLARDGALKPDTIEAKSEACRQILKNRFKLEDQKLPENPNGMDLLAERAKASYKNVYDTMLSGKDVKGEAKDKLLKDIKTITLYQFVSLERERLGKNGLIANSVQNSTTQLDSLIDAMDSKNMPGIDALKEPSLKNIEKMYAKNQVGEVIEKAVKDVEQKDRAQKKALKAKKEAEKQKKTAGPKI